MRNVGMIERSQHFGFALEASHAAGIAGEGLGDYLQRHVALQPGVAGTIDLSHAARADGREDFVGPEMFTGLEVHFYFFSKAGQLTTTVNGCTPFFWATDTSHRLPSEAITLDIG